MDKALEVPFLYITGKRNVALRRDQARVERGFQDYSKGSRSLY